MTLVYSAPFRVQPTFDPYQDPDGRSGSTTN
jgi:hypothetical protein